MKTDSQSIDSPGDASPIDAAASRWHTLAARILQGHRITRDEANSVLEADDAEVLDLTAAAYRVRRHFFGNRVQLYFLMNAKSGLCPEDCGYCSQSKVSDADIPKYNLLTAEKLLDGARVAAERQSKTYCIVISGRAPTRRELDALTEIVPRIKQQHDLKICACLGLLDDEQARRLKECGVDRVNHNVNTSADHYDEICSTHTYDDRIRTLTAARAAGLELCSGGIIGMGETYEQVVDMAIQLRDIGVESVPLNFLNAVKGTPLAELDQLTPRFCLKVLAMFRFVHPDRELRIAGGREIHLRSLQPLGLYAANSLFVGDYLTTPGQPPESDYAMLEDLGFEICRSDEVACK